MKLASGEGSKWIYKRAIHSWFKVMVLQILCGITESILEGFNMGDQGEPWGCLS